jgi:phosphoesterase RecJ-like protein
MPHDTTLNSKHYSLDEIRALLRGLDDFVIAGHINPDGDAVGACFALGLALEKMHKKCRVVLEPYADRLDIIPGKNLLYKGSMDDLHPQALICLDCGDLERLGGASALTNRAVCTVCIDHHVTNTGYAQYNYIDGDASSTCELIYKLIYKEVDIDVPIASALYAGMVNDTGGFRHRSTSRETMHIAGLLLEAGIPFTEIYTRITHQRSFAEVKLFGRVLETCVRSWDNKMIYACVTRAMLVEFGATRQHLDGVVEYLLNIQGAEVAILFCEKNDPIIKVSFRSHDLDVGRIAADLGGGGHALAAGCDQTGSMEEVKEKILAALKKEMDKP